MSLDTVSRVGTTATTRLSPYKVIDSSLAQNMEPRNFGGPFIYVDVEVFDDMQSDDFNSYMETGVIVFKIYNEERVGNRDIYTIADLIKTQFRDNRIDPAMGEEGTIFTQDLTARPLFTETNPRNNFNWNRYDILINYKKCYT